MELPRLKNRLKTLKGNFEELKNKSETSIEKLKNQQESAREDLKDIGDRQYEVEERVQDLKDKVVSLEEQGSQISKQDFLVQEIEKMETTLKRQKVRDQELIQRTMDNKERLEGLNERLRKVDREVKKRQENIEMQHEKTEILEINYKRICQLFTEKRKQKQNVEEEILELKENLWKAEEDQKALRDQIKRFQNQKLKTERKIEENRKWIDINDQKFDQIRGEVDPIEVKLYFKKRSNRQNSRIRLQELSREIKLKKNKILELQPKINKNADNRTEMFKDKMLLLESRKNILKKDEKELRLDLNSMDEISLKSYHICFKQVNLNLGGMFARLLPGAHAEMREIELDKGGTGIEIRISFNGKWKDSLSELSGGQRSLLALSLLLSMLKYKSAPFYILDEIDAAMDLSHTENIGTIISENFPESQFIVISLKKGMFSSANVLYKTSLRDGSSMVTRIQQKENRVMDRFNGDSSMMMNTPVKRIKNEYPYN